MGVPPKSRDLPNGPLARAVVAALKDNPQTTRGLVTTLYGEWSERRYASIKTTVWQLEKKGWISIDRSTRPAVISAKGERMKHRTVEADPPADAPADRLREREAAK